MMCDGGRTYSISLPRVRIMYIYIYYDIYCVTMNSLLYVCITYFYLFYILLIKIS